MSEDMNEPEREPQGGQQPSEEPDEEEMRAKLEEEMRKVTVRDLLLQSCVAVANLGFQKLGMTEQTKDLRDLPQARAAIEALRALLPILEAEKPEELRPLRDGLSQLQMAYAQAAGGEESGEGEGVDERPADAAQGPKAREREQAKSSGRIWVPPGSKP